MKNFYVVLGAVAAVGLGVFFYSVRDRGAATEPVSLPEDMAGGVLRELAQGVVYGDPDAPITILEFGDYECPACRQFGLTIKPQLDLAYIQNGQAKLVFHDFPLPGHPNSFIAARAVRCAGDQSQYFEYHDLVFRTQDDWRLTNGAARHFKSLAGDLGLDTRAFNACFDSDRHADVVTANLEMGRRMGVGGTPSVFVHAGEGSEILALGGFQFIDVQQAVDQLLQN